ncbi:MAG: response regulator [Bacteroidales bacterium]|nr:response regulator [Bacteroidales bacterium]
MKRKLCMIGIAMKDMEKILLIEDDKDFSEMLSLMLEREGYAVERAENGIEGLQMIEKDTFDLVITDIIMPEKEGLETIMEIRQLKPESKIVAISGGGRSAAGSYLKTAEYFGAIKAFQKPFDKTDFLVAVKNILGA